MRSGASRPDPLRVDDSLPASGTYWKVTAGLARREITINPAHKTCVLIAAGQSNMTSLQPTLYTPLNSGVVSHMNIYDGAFYPISGPLLGTNYTPGLGPGNLTARVADMLVGMSGFNQVLLVNIALDGSNIDDWASGALMKRPDAAMRRLKARGIQPGMTGVHFAFLFGQGEAEVGRGTSQAAYAARLATLKQNLADYGFNGRMFINRQTWAAGAVNAGVQAAQVAAANGTDVFVGGDLDTLGATYRHADNVHFKDNGADAAATLIYNAMVASGAPY